MPRGEGGHGPEGRTEPLVGEIKKQPIFKVGDLISIKLENGYVEDGWRIRYFAPNKEGVEGKRVVVNKKNHDGTYAPDEYRDIEEVLGLNPDGAKG